MADARSTTSIDIKVNAREVGALQRTLRKVFDRRLPQSYTRAVGEVNSRLRDNLRETERIVRALAKVKRGSAAYDDLREKLKAANSEARQLGSTLNRLSAPTGGGTGGGYGGGMAAMGGRGFGGMQVPTPGGGAITTALQALPFAGLAMAGAYMAASGTYGSFTRQQQAEMRNAAFLTSSARSSRYQSRASLVGGRAAGPLAGRSDADLMNEWVQGARSGIGGRITLGAESIVSGIENAVFDSPGGGRGNMMERRARRALETRYGTGAFDAGSPARMVRSRPFDPSAFVTAGQGFAVTPQESVQLAGQLSQGMHHPATAGGLSQALAARQLFGVGVESTGQLRGALSRTGAGPEAGGTGAMSLVLATAVRLGLESSEISEYMREQSGFLRTIEAQGGQMLLGGMLAGQEALRAGGIRGFRTGQIARGIGSASNRIGRQGIQSGADLRMMKALGYTGRGGREEYAKFSLMAQDPGRAAAAIPQLVEGMMTDFNLDPNSEFGVMMVQRLLGSLGTPVGADEARNMMTGVGSMKRGLTSSLATTSQDLGGLTQGLIASGRGMAADTGGTLIEQAAIERERVATGAQMAGTMLALERTTVNLASTFSNTLGPAVDEVAEGMERLTARLDGLSDQMWVGPGNVNLRR